MTRAVEMYYALVAKLIAAEAASLQSGFSYAELLSARTTAAVLERR